MARQGTEKKKRLFFCFHHAVRTPNQKEVGSTTCVGTDMNSAMLGMQGGCQAVWLVKQSDDKPCQCLITAVSAVSTVQML